MTWFPRFIQQCLPWVNGRYGSERDAMHVVVGAMALGWHVEVK